MDQSELLEKKREAFRAKYTGVLFNAYLNAFLVFSIFMTSLFFSGMRVSWDITAFLLLPIAFLYGEFAMYLAHRFQQHKKRPLQERVFEMHAVWHHGMFSDNRMHVDSIKDMNMVILPFFIHGFVLGVIYLPIAVLVQHYFLSDTGWLLMFSITLQLFWYEFVHTLSHVENPPFLKILASHHKLHHSPKLMGNYNFGISATIFDNLFKTRYRLL